MTRSARPAQRFLRTTSLSIKFEIAVTLSPELFDRLCAEARELGLTLEWLVALLVADTLDEALLELAIP